MHGKGVARTSAQIVARRGDGNGERVFTRLRRGGTALVRFARIGRTRIQGRHAPAARICAGGEHIIVRLLAIDPVLDGDGEREAGLLNGDRNVRLGGLVVGGLLRIDAHAQPVALGNRRKGIVAVNQRRLAVVEHRAAVHGLQASGIQIVRLYAAHIDDRPSALDDQPHRRTDEIIGSIIRARFHRIGARLCRRICRGPRSAVVGGTRIIEVDVARHGAADADQPCLDRPAVIDAVLGKFDPQICRHLCDRIGAVFRGDDIVIQRAAHGHGDGVRADRAAALAREGNDYAVCLRILFKDGFARVPRQFGAFAVNHRLIVRSDGNGERCNGEHVRRTRQSVVVHVEGIILRPEHLKGVSSLIDVAEGKLAQRQSDVCSVNADKVCRHRAELILAVVDERILRPNDCNFCGYDLEIFHFADQLVVFQVDAVGPRYRKGIDAGIDKVLTALHRDGQIDALVVRIVEIRRDIARMIGSVIDELFARPDDGHAQSVDSQRRRQREFGNSFAAYHEYIVGTGGNDGHGDLLRPDIRTARTDRVRQADPVRSRQLCCREYAVRIGNIAHRQREILFRAVVYEGIIRKAEEIRRIGALFDCKRNPFGRRRREVCVTDDAAHLIFARIPDKAVVNGDSDPCLTVPQLPDITERRDVQSGPVLQFGARLDREQHRCSRIHAPARDGYLRHGHDDVPFCERQDTPCELNRVRAALKAIIAIYRLGQGERRRIAVDIDVAARIQYDPRRIRKELCKFLLPGAGQGKGNIFARERLRRARIIHIFDGELFRVDLLLLHGKLHREGRRSDRIVKGVIAGSICSDLREHPYGARIDVRREPAIRITAVIQRHEIVDRRERNGRPRTVAENDIHVTVPVDIRRVRFGQPPVDHAVRIGNGDLNADDLGGRDRDAAVLHVDDLVIGELIIRDGDGITADIPRARMVDDDRRDLRPLISVKRLRQLMGRNCIAVHDHDKATEAVVVDAVDVELRLTAGVYLRSRIFQCDGHLHRNDGVVARCKFPSEDIVLIRLGKTGHRKGIAARVDKLPTVLYCDGEVADRTVRLDKVSVYEGALIAARIGEAVCTRPYDICDGDGRDLHFGSQLRRSCAVCKDKVCRIRAVQFQRRRHCLHALRHIRCAARIAGDADARGRIAQRRVLQLPVVNIFVNVILIAEPGRFKIIRRGRDFPSQPDADRRAVRPAIVAAGDLLECDRDRVSADIIRGDLPVRIGRPRRSGKGHELGVETEQTGILRRKRLAFTRQIGALIDSAAAFRGVADRGNAQPLRRDLPIKRERSARTARPDEVPAGKAHDGCIIARVHARVAGEDHRRDRLPVRQGDRRRESVQRICDRCTRIFEGSRIARRRRSQRIRGDGEMRIAERHAVGAVLRAGHIGAHPVAACGEHGKICNGGKAEASYLLFRQSRSALRVGIGDDARIKIPHATHGRRRPVDRGVAIRPIADRNFDFDQRRRDGKADGVRFAFSIPDPVIIVGIQQPNDDEIRIDLRLAIDIPSVTVLLQIVCRIAAAGSDVHNGGVVADQIIPSVCLPRLFQRERFMAPVDGDLLLLDRKGVDSLIAIIIVRTRNGDAHIIGAGIRIAAECT